MRKDEIKIIKRINIGKVAEKLKVPANVIKIKSNLQVGIVKDWITERQENRRIEKLFSENKILNWKIATPKLTKSTR